MGKVLLVTGGSRSGKSSFALEVADKISGARTFVATCPVTDDEMQRRIEAHQAERAGGGWATIEEQTELCGALLRAKDSRVILVDCLTLWVNNLMYERSNANEEFVESHIEAAVREVIEICRKLPGVVIFVTNEVGLGIVPGDEYTRRYRDLVGRCNQVFGASADAVALAVCGIATFIKGELKDVVD